MNSIFNEQILADKLSKLNSTQQCIETLSHWCIFHQNKAELVVTTWDKQFHSSQKEQKVPFLYLANDILQNSKRKGNEFVSEFWKVLPAALKDVVENGDDRGKNVVSRLVDIWEERKVFGSRTQGLRDLMLGKELPPPLDLSKKRSRSVRIVRRDSRSIRTKLAIGGTAEKIVSAFHAVLSEHPSEDEDMNKCKTAVHRVRKMEKEAEIACTKVGDPKRTTLANELEEEEAVLKKCIEKLQSVEATRAALVSQLKEALHEQESELENVRTQLQVAQAQAVEAGSMQRRLRNDTDVAVSNASTANPQTETNAKAGELPKKTAAAIAAEVADKLAASTSSQMIMTSVLSTFAAQEAKNVGFATGPSQSKTSSNMPTNSSSESRSQLEKPMAISDAMVYIAAQQQSGAPSHQYQTVMVQPSLQAQASSSQVQYHVLQNQPSQQYVQPSGSVMTAMPYGYSYPPPLPPGPPPHILSLAAPLTQQQPVPLARQQPVLMTQQPPAPPSFRPLQPPGMVYYTHTHQPQ
ncbi:PREDICTED: histone acetyltransferase KAT6A [Nelumbo nucifera]|uniref:Histone acetyltransferase KAT6A n=1 Tax=Nelumbo nucifera TaxID=4432 RepID=A0A1U8AFN5_NELNU|nr:PREDICTED: histone acetyltransferase KAT6A [Nelumbo nucifera]XP_010261191.1 PREDICTED: histone acetyltransferase KAT6A [Nelumbo nucifera]XP_010261192.1 PREDICTED: histone acetyltransferase KAT6A [Nelumbo nucifera]XP_010261193.1 PREDICTED: histone acetyltransferase KAT6A [Nelumbo nucifera]XP_010261194.1 PREDICTED: histone acetyltransferase KAT6A [Nelumbo nucifera]